MKKLIALVLVLVMCLSLVACGGPDKQPAIDSYNRCSEAYNEFVAYGNEHLDAFTDEDIEFFNAIADYLSECADKLEGDTEFTQEEIDEMVEMFDEFTGVMEEAMADLEG